MQRRSNSIKFLEAYDPALRKEGTNFNEFFTNLEIGDLFKVDPQFDTNFIINLANKQYGIILCLITNKDDWNLWSIDEVTRIFKVTNYTEIKLTDYWYNETIRIFRDLCKEERIYLMDRVYNIFCKDCMKELKEGKLTCDCEYGPTNE
jgi:hypothetical protein